MKLIDLLNLDQITQFEKIRKSVSFFTNKIGKCKFFINVYKDICSIYISLRCGNPEYSYDTPKIKERLSIEIKFNTNLQILESKTYCFNKIDDDFIPSCQIYEIDNFKPQCSQFEDAKVFKVNQELLKKLINHSKITVNLSKVFPSVEKFFYQIIEDVDGKTRVSSTDGRCLITEISETIPPDFKVEAPSIATKIYNDLKSKDKFMLFKKPIKFSEKNYHTMEDVFGTLISVEFDNIAIHKTAISRSDKPKEYDLITPRIDAVTKEFNKSGWSITLNKNQIKQLEENNNISKLDRIIIDVKDKKFYLYKNESHELKELIEQKDVISKDRDKIFKTGFNFYLLRLILFINFLKKTKGFNTNKDITFYEQNNKGVPSNYQCFLATYSTESSDIEFCMAPISPITY